SKRLFCWFFDIITQNGGLETLSPQRVKDFIAANSPDHADDVICDFLAAVKGTAGHVKDANKNGLLWRNKPDAEQMMVLVMSYLRS
ncbi:peptidoglycan-binding domain 1 protein, partial [Escherichia coli]